MICHVYKIASCRSSYIIDRERIFGEMTLKTEPKIHTLVRALHQAAIHPHIQPQTLHSDKVQYALILKLLLCFSVVFTSTEKIGTYDSYEYQ